MGTTEKETVGITAPKHVLVALVALLLGSGASVGVSSLADRPDRVDVTAEAVAAARVYTDQVAARLVDDTRREIAAAQAVQVQALSSFAASFSRLESKVDRLTDDISGLKADIAGIKAERRPR